MLTRALFALLLSATLAACERSHDPVQTDADGAKAAVSPDKKTVSAAPEHFDRVRDEQLEKEEDRLRQRGRHN